MPALPPCPRCDSPHTYELPPLLVCPECAHEWAPSEPAAEPRPEEEEGAVRDAHGTVLQDGDDVIVIRDLKVKGSSLTVKSGTRVKRIRLVEGDHDIDCRIPGIGGMKLKSEFVRKG